MESARVIRDTDHRRLKQLAELLRQRINTYGKVSFIVGRAEGRRVPVTPSQQGDLERTAASCERYLDEMDRLLGAPPPAKPRMTAKKKAEVAAQAKAEAARWAAQRRAEEQARRPAPPPPPVWATKA